MNSDLMKMLQANDEIQDVTGQPFFTEYDPETKRLSPAFDAPITRWEILNHEVKKYPAHEHYPGGEWLSIIIQIDLDGDDYAVGWDKNEPFELIVDKAFDMNQIQRCWNAPFN